MKKLAILALLTLLACGPAWSAITFIDATSSTSGAAVQRTPDEPTGAQENDLILAFCQMSLGTGNTWTDPADFIEIDQPEALVGTDQIVYYGYKVRGSDAGSGYQFTAPESAALACSLYAFRGVDTSTPLDVTWAIGTHFLEDQNTTNIDPPSITTATDGAVVVLMHGFSTTIDGPGGPPANYTETEDFVNGGGSHRGQYVAYRTIATAGAEDPGVFTHTDTTGTADSHVGVIALKTAATAQAAWNSAPIVMSATADTYTVSFETDIDATVYGVACVKDSATPTGAQIVAGDCTGDVDAKATCTEATTGGVPDSCTLTPSDDPKFPVYDLHFIGCPEPGVC